MVLSREEIMKLPTHQRKGEFKKRTNFRKHEARKRLKEKLKREAKRRSVKNE